MSTISAPHGAHLRLIAALFSLLALSAAACSSSTETAVSTEESAPSDTSDDAPPEPTSVDSSPAATSSADTEPHHDHDEAFDVTYSPVPALTLELFADPKSGWNVHAIPADFQLAPQHASTDPIDGEGHMHLFVDGEKITRLYGEWYYLAPLGEGTHDIRVELSANNHQPLGVNGDLIDAAVTVEEAAVAVAGDEDGGHDHDANADGDDDAMAEHDADDGDGAMADHDDDAMAEHDADDGDDAMADHDDDAMADHDADPSMADTTIMVTVSGDEVDGGGRHEVTAGDVVTVRVEADTVDEVHVHGYDVVGPVGPDSPAEFTFAANLPGVWEVELEGSGILLFELQVS